MKNRNIPFGYRFDGGIAVIDQTEKKTLERIITEYLDGKSLLKIAEAALRSQGFAEHPVICWDHINLQDETELAEARLKNAQAHEIELRNQITETEMRKDCSNV